MLDHFEIGASWRKKRKKRKNALKSDFRRRLAMTRQGGAARRFGWVRLAADCFPAEAGGAHGVTRPTPQKCF
jgi:hypothetical protein